MKPPRKTVYTGASRLLVLLASFFALATSVQAQFSSPIIIDTVLVDIENETEFDEDNDTPGLIVLVNVANDPVNLNGWFLTNDAAVPNKWQFTEDYVLDPGDKLIVFASGKNRPGVPPGKLPDPPHTNFSDPCDTFTQLRTPQLQLADQKSGISPLCGPTSSCLPGDTVLVGVDDFANWWVPFNGNDDVGGTGSSWVDIDFNPPTQFPPGQGCFGFDIDPLCAGLVLYAPLNTADIGGPSGLTVFDRSDSPTIHHGTMQPFALPVVPAQIDEGLRFIPTQGEEACVVFDTSAELEPGLGEFTTGVWARPSTFGERMILASKQIEGGPGWVLFLDADKLVFRVYEPSGIVHDDAVMPLNSNPGDWFYAAAGVHFNAEGERFMRLFIDGSLVDERQIEPALYIGSADALLRLGCGPKNVLPFSGDLDDFAIWCSCLSDEQVQGVYTEGAAKRSFKDSCQNNTLYGHLIRTNTASDMLKRNCTLYTRYEFSLNSVPAVNLIESLRLCINYEDGFIAYLNGVEVASSNQGGNKFDSCAAKGRSDELALTTDVFDISSFKNLLRTGQNVLAIHGMNERPEDGRFLLCAELCMKEIVIGDCSKDTLGDDFWLAFPQNFPADDTNPLNLSLCLTAPVSQSPVGGPPSFVSATVDIPGLNLSGWPKTVLIDNIAPGGTHACIEVAIPVAAELVGSDLIEDKGIHITATADIAAYGLSKLDYSSDTYLGLPTDCVGRNYIVPCYKNTVTASSGLSAVNGSQFAIVATQDDTQVRILVPVATPDHAANAVYEITLNQGQTYQLRNVDVPSADLSGTRIMSTKPVGVFGGHRFALVPESDYFFADHMVEQILPLNAWGMFYVSSPLDTRSFDVLRVIAAENTTVTIVPTSGSITPTGGATLFGTSNIPLSAGETLEFTTGSACWIQAEQLIQVSQVSPSSDFDNVIDSDPFMIALQPLGSWMNEYTLCRPNPSEWTEQRLGIITFSIEGGTSVNVNGSTRFINNTVVQPFPNVTFSWGNIDLSEISGDCLHITSQNPFALISYGFDEYEGYGNTGGMRWQDVPPEVSTPLQITHRCESLDNQGACTFPAPDVISLSSWSDNCVPNSLLTVSQTPPAGTLLSGPGEHIIRVNVTDTLNGDVGYGQTIVTILPPWIEEFFSSPPDPVLSDPNADPDCDGVINLIEKVNGTDPLSPNHDPGFEQYWEKIGGQTYARFRLRRPIFPNGDFVEVQRSTTLPGGFSPVFSDLQEITTLRQLVEGGEFIEYHYRILYGPTQPQPRAFYTITFEDN